jgi:predicted PurR-regulated permease PerM
MSLGGTVRGDAGKHIPITFFGIIQSAFAGSVFLGFGGAILGPINTFFVVKKSDANDQ